jgi:hypothetical protein
MQKLLTESTEFGYSTLSDTVHIIGFTILKVSKKEVAENNATLICSSIPKLDAFICSPPNVVTAFYQTQHIFMI